MKKIVYPVFMIFLIYFISAEIRINEIEINPSEGRSGTEWIELYSDKEMDISGWEIYDGLTSQTKRYIIPEGTKIKEFYIIEFERAVLNNGGDFIILKNKESVVDKTPVLKESVYSSKTWQYCDGEWDFLEKTKNRKNNCKDETNEDEKIVEKALTYETKKEKSDSMEKIDTKETIRLIPKNIKDKNFLEKIDKRDFSLYGLIAFSILLLFLFILKIQGSKKDELQ